MPIKEKNHTGTDFSSTLHKITQWRDVCRALREKEKTLGLQNSKPMCELKKTKHF